MSEEELPDNSPSSHLIPEAASRGSVGDGVTKVLLLHLLQLPAGLVFGPIVLPVICVTQLVYVIPALVIAWRKGHKETVKGIIIAASLTALLNIACTGVFYAFIEFG